MNLNKNLYKENGDSPVNLSAMGLIHCPVCYHPVERICCILFTRIFLCNSETCPVYKNHPVIFSS